MQEAKELARAFSQKVIDPLINVLMAKTPNDNKWLRCMRGVIVNDIAPNDLRARIRNALESIIIDLLSHLSKNDVYKILQQWRNGMRKLGNKSSDEIGREKEEWGYVTPQEMMNITDPIINVFYESGRRYYLAQEFDKASDVFLLVVILDFLRPHSWLALGLCEEHMCRWNEALYSFAIAALLEENAPMPHIHSAECYIAMNKFSDAQASLSLVTEILQNNQSEANGKLNDYISLLKNKCGNGSIE